MYGDSQTKNVPQWNQETDVLVIGSGFAGLAAAIEAHSAGASVIVVEKMQAPGGNSSISDGGVAAAGTPMQRAADIVDSPDLMYADMVRAPFTGGTWMVVAACRFLPVVSWDGSGCGNGLDYSEADEEDHADDQRDDW